MLYEDDIKRKLGEFRAETEAVVKELERERQLCGEDIFLYDSYGVKKYVSDIDPEMQLAILDRLVELSAIKTSQFVRASGGNGGWRLDKVKSWNKRFDRNYTVHEIIRYRLINLSDIDLALLLSEIKQPVIRGPKYRQIGDYQLSEDGVSVKRFGIEMNQLTSQQKKLVATFLLKENHSLNKYEITKTIWSDGPPDHTNDSIKSLVSKTRASLRSAAKLADKSMSNPILLDEYTSTYKLIVTIE
jgi:hypothetical protein